MNKHTPGPWSVRTRVDRSGEIADCFVTAKDVNGFAYDAEILGDDEYRDGMERKLADCHLTSAAPDLLEAIEDRAVKTAIDSGLGVSEWKCFLTEKEAAAIAKALGEP